MIVFDLDYCLWTPEMYTLNEKPSIPKLNTNGLVIGMQVPQGPTVSLFPGARKVLEHLHSERETTYKDVKLALASSSEEPTFSVSCLEIEIVEGCSMRSLFNDASLRQIGRRGNLSSNKITHFTQLQKATGVDLSHSLFFDDCNWGDHCAVVANEFNVVTQKTPNGLQWKEFTAALAKFAACRS
ncbi:hypothetical protein ScalyP_jg9814 [Parmales sp. scaly parma]|nr:hypothetical protein ScalyP_jg9814 [Parmales sp. scaly parma]